jgi:hypothetical protein
LLSFSLAINAHQLIWKRATTSTADRISTAKSWLHDCSLNHQRCKPGVTQLPKRLIDVGSLNGRSPRLIISEDLHSLNIEYATLSYCWGSANFCTTRENEDLYSTEIPYHLLPATLQDALTLTRHLHIPFLWIDALCIVQDDLAEWEIEASRMQDIYCGSSLTIAASDAADGSEGCFPDDTSIERESSKRNAFLAVSNIRDGSEIIVRVQTGDVREYAADSVLNTRGWVLQEMVLSHRVLHLMRSGLYWDCRCECRTETGLVFDQSKRDYARIPVLPNDIQIRTNRSWWKWMQSYSRRRFSFPEDRLPALSGLIRHYQKVTKDVPILGLWEHSLCRDLLWERVTRLAEGAERTPDHLANIPSWTWLSCPYEVRFSDWSQLGVHEDYHVRTIEWAVVWTSEPLTSTVKSTRLVLDGPVQEIVLSVAPNQPESQISPSLVTDEEKPDVGQRQFTSRCSGQFDDGPRSSPAQYLCLLVRSLVCKNGDTETTRETFLILEPCLGTNSYRRVGLGNFNILGRNRTFDLAVTRTLIIS